ncbi:MAG: hypothetical protein JW726_01055 [Anaerolineales bacterium]|nr:hypothetical protein [Anaerolineales bacterium]
MESAQDSQKARNLVEISDGRWQINGQVTDAGAKAEGLLLNVRMVNAVFEDRNHPEIDAWDITRRFISQIREYALAGVKAFSLCLQGGYPGYMDALNSAYLPDGTLRPDYMSRVAEVIDACDMQGLVVILGCYYQLQSGILRDQEAVNRGVIETVRWIGQRGYRNVVLEIANEFGQDGFVHACLREEHGIVELIDIAHQTAPGILVSASRQGDLPIASEVCEACDFLLVHFNRVALADYPALIAQYREYGKPVVCSEDRKVGAEGVRAAELCVAHGCSWGFLAREVNQYHPPFRFEGVDDDPLVYAALKRLAEPVKVD